MLRVDERGERVERDVLREREADREPPRREVRPPLDGLEPEPEDRAVRRVQHEPGRLPASPAGDELPEQRDVPVVRAEEPLVERLEQPPDRRRSRPGGRRADTARYLHSLSLGADGATLGGVPEGDSLHRAARRLRVLVGERLEVEAPHPRGQLTGVAEQLDGRRLESVEAVGKNLLLRFEGGLVLRSHLRMKGRWWVRPRGSPQLGRPWLRVGDATDEDLLRALEAAHRLMSDSAAGVRGRRHVYRRAGRLCPRCGAAVHSRGQGDANRTAYWCPGCQG